LRADPGAADARIVIVDGGSSDNSAAIVRDIAVADARVRLLNNPKRIQSAAINLAARQFVEADYLVRVDAHARYPSDYIARLIGACEESGADCVTVSMRAEAAAPTCFEQANAAAQNSVLGAGGSPHRKSGPRRWVEHGHHALMRMATFASVEGYNEAFTHNEDAELDARICANGGKILLAADIVIGYFPRATARALLRQYFKFGAGRARMLLLHREPPKPRQLAPALILPAVLLAPFAPLWIWAAAPAALWLFACLSFGALLGLKQKSLCAAASGIPAALMHLGWSTGFWIGALTSLGAKPSAPQSASGDL
jgi:succinoglycan biosynthesis protein ExoA